MLPIYTRHLTPADYGVVEMMSVVTSVLALIAGTHIGLATIKFYHSATSENQRRVVLSTATFTILSGSALVYAAFALAMQTAAGPVVAHATLGSTKLIPLLLLFSLVIVFQPIEEQMFTVLRLKNNPWGFIALSIAKLALQLGLNILFVVFLNMKVKGVVLGSIISTGGFALISFAYTRHYSGWHFSRTICKNILTFIFPLMLGAFGTLYMSVSDRYILQGLHDSASVGLYALGARFADILMVTGWWPFINVWQVHRFEILAAPDAIKQYQRVFVAVSIYLIWISLGIAVLTHDVLHILATAGFWPAATITPPLLIATLLAAAIGFCNFSFLVTDRTGFIAKGTWISALALTIAYIAFIPSFGPLGAAWAKVTAASIQLAITVYWSQRTYPMNLPWRQSGTILVLAIGFYLVSRVSAFTGWPALLMELLLLAAFPLFAIYGPLLPNESRLSLQTQAKDLWGTLKGALGIPS